jgi:hypothetical protein
MTLSTPTCVDFASEISIATNYAALTMSREYWRIDREFEDHGAKFPSAQPISMDFEGAHEPTEVPATSPWEYTTTQVSAPASWNPPFARDGSTPAGIDA